MTCFNNELIITMKTKLLMIVALVCLVAQGTLAQAEVNDEAGLTEAIGTGSNVSIKLAGNIGLPLRSSYPATKR